MSDKPKTLESVIAEWKQAAVKANGPRQRLGDNFKDAQYGAMLRQQGLCADELAPIAARLRELVKEMRDCAEYKDTHTLPENRNPYKTGFGDGFKWALGKLEAILDGKE